MDRRQIVNVSILYKDLKVVFLKEDSQIGYCNNELDVQGVLQERKQVAVLKFSNYTTS